jgi:isovaleryl-CoA dehydrogenase
MNVTATRPVHSVLELSEERQALVEAIRAFASRECGTAEQRANATNGGADSHSAQLFSQLGGLGYLGVTIPEAHGGGGGSVVDGCLVLEEIEYGLIPVFGLGVSLITAATVEKFGTEDQQLAVFDGVNSGRVQSIAMSEPGSGSDVASLTASARRTDAGWVLNGQKTWTTAAHHAEHILVVARTDRDAPKHRGISMFLVPATTPGVEVRPIRTMGPREVNDVYLTDVELSADALVGAENGGWRQLMAGLNFERLIGGAVMIGVARRAFDEALQYARAREQFGRPVGSFQALKHMFADLATEIECTRLLIYDVARRVEANPSQMLTREVSMVKLKASEVARRVALDGMQIMGGAGYASEYEMEHLVRKALPMTVYAGTSQIQRDIIGGTYGL